MQTILKTLAAAIILFVASVSVSAQEGVVKGTVKDEGGQPVLGAVVFYQDTNVSATTDANGYYSIKSMPGKTLVFSMLGMLEQRFAISGPKSLDIILQNDSQQLEDVVVIGYGTQKREDLTGSISSVNADEIKKAASPSIVGSLQGKVAGLNITSQSGEPGAGYQIRIRGANSINASSEPLYIIDGVQMDLSSSTGAESDLSDAGTDPLAFLNPSDIKSIEVLKDASASAIYGARGANGVIIITTKGGVDNAGKTSVTLDASVGIATAARRLEMLNGQEWVNFRWERADYGGGSSFDDPNNPGHPIDVSDKEWFNWQDLMYRTAVTQNYGATIRGQVGKNTQFLLSGSYMNQQGLVLGNDYKRYTGRVKVDHNINKKLKVGASIAYSQNVGDGAMTSNGGGSGFTQNGLIQLIYRERPIGLMTNNEDDYLMTHGFTALTSMVDGKTLSKKRYQRVVGNAYLDWTIIDGLKLSLQASGTTSNSNLKEFFSKDSRWGKQNEGVINHKDVTSMSYNASIRLSYKKQWKKAHNFEAMIGGEIGDQMYESMKLSAYKLSDEATTMYNIAKGAIQKAPDQQYYTVGRMSAFGRVNYNYKSRYYVTATLRADGSSRFSEGHRVGYFPSASLGWRASKESFLKSQRWLSNLMLRASAGASGNDRIPMYSNLAKMEINYVSIGGTESMGMSSVSSANHGLKWETTYQYNIGLDFSVLKNRISLTADVYYKDTRDMLYLATVSSQSGFLKSWKNLGRVDNRGIEITLNTRNIDKRGFLWTTNLSFDIMRNRIRNIGDGITESAITFKGNFNNEVTRLIVGQPIGATYGYEAIGNYQFEDFIIKKGGTEITDYSEITRENFDTYTYTLKPDVPEIHGKTSRPGDRKYADLDGDGTVTTEDRKVLSNPYPKFSAGMGNTFSWRGLELYIFLDGAYGRDILNEFKMRTESGELGATHQYNISRASYLGAWRPDNPSNTYSALRNQTNTWCSSYYVEDASFIRLKTVALSYSLPAKICNKIHFKGLKFTFTADNLATFTKFSGMDPSLSYPNALCPAYDTMTYPLARTFTFGITANL